MSQARTAGIRVETGGIRMVQDPSPSGSPSPRLRPTGGRHRVALRAASVATVAILVAVGVDLGGIPGVRTSPSMRTEFPSDTDRDVPQAIAAGIETDAEASIPDPAPMLGPEATRHWREALPTAFPDWSSERPQAGIEPATPFARQTPDAPPSAESERLAQSVPLPVPRPPEFRRPNPSETIRRADRSTSRRNRTAAAAPAPVADERNFFEKLFNVERPATPALAYAALEMPSRAAIPRPRLIPVPDPAATAVYDISARIVTLPNGTKLEAHSGLGENMDDPRNVHLRMRGATPPGTYDLTEREDLFHGVRAIRLTPVGGRGAVYGRVGLLAHTYMLGPSGASNGCVSFRDYQAFLQAYLRGEIQRLVVVSGRGQDMPPSVAQQNQPVPGRAARLGNDV